VLGASQEPVDAESICILWGVKSDCYGYLLGRIFLYGELFGVVFGLGAGQPRR
jgi:hypothetical protein